MSSSVFTRAAKITRGNVQKKLGTKYLPYNHVALIGDPILRQPAVDFDVNVYNSADVKLFEKHNPAVMATLNKLEKFSQYGWVITAPQVGLPIKLMLAQLHLNFEDDGFNIKGTENTKKYVFANPEVRPVTTERAFSVESSLSVPCLSGVVERHQVVELTAYDLAARRVVKMTLTPPDSFIIQNGIDQLNGVIFIDKVRDKESLGVIEYDLVRCLPEMSGLDYLRNTNLIPSTLDVQRHLSLYKSIKGVILLSFLSMFLLYPLKHHIDMSRS